MSVGVVVALPPPNRMFSVEASKKFPVTLYTASVVELVPPKNTCASVQAPLTDVQWKSVV